MAKNHILSEIVTYIIIIGSFGPSGNLHPRRSTVTYLQPKLFGREVSPQIAGTRVLVIQSEFLSIPSPTPWGKNGLLPATPVSRD